MKQLLIRALTLEEQVDHQLTKREPVSQRACRLQYLKYILCECLGSVPQLQWFQLGLTAKW